MYIALYRKYRPTRFEDICGQEHITTSLKNQIRADKISHAYLFCGTRGTGKTSTAKLLARAVNCLDLQDGNPCEKCESCKSINEGNSIDVFEIDAASNRGIDNIRDLREAVKFTPIGKYKLYIIDEVHMLTNEAFNALLKTLEEPPEYVIFILATTEPHKLPATVLSRCQRFDFKRISKKSMLERLDFICKEEDIKAEAEALQLIVRNTDGAMRDAINIMDQCSVYSNKNISADDVLAVLGIVNDRYLFEMSDSILNEDVTKTIKLLREISDEGKDIVQFTQDLQGHYRNLLMSKLVTKAEGVIDLSEEKVKILTEQSRRYSKESIIRCINILSDLTLSIKWSPQPMLLLEIALIKMSRLEKDVSIEGLMARLAKLEDIIAKGGKWEIAGADNFVNKNIPMNEDASETIGDADTVASSIPINPDEQKIIVSNDIVNQNIPVCKDKDIPETTTDGDLIDSNIKTKIMESWDDFVKDFGKRKRMVIRTYLASCKPLMIDNQKVILCFGEKDNFSKESVEKVKIKNEIEEAAKKYFNIPLTIKPMFEDEIKAEEIGPADPASLKVTDPESGPTDFENIENSFIQDENYIIEKAIEVFGEDLVEIVDD